MKILASFALPFSLIGIGCFIAKAAMGGTLEPYEVALSFTNGMVATLGFMKLLEEFQK